MPNIMNHAISQTTAVLVITFAATSHATTTYSTNFTGQASGSQAASIGDVDFNDPGRVQFFANGSYYVPNSNRAWGFSDEGEVNIAFGDFSEGVPNLLADAGSHAASVDIWLRGSQAEDRDNTNSLNFHDSLVSFVWYDEDNVRWVGGVSQAGGSGVSTGVHATGNVVLVGNDAYQRFTIDPTVVGADAVSRIRVFQDVDADRAYALVGSLEYTQVPEPASIGLLTAGCLAGLRRRRSA